MNCRLRVAQMPLMTTSAHVCFSGDRQIALSVGIGGLSIG